MFPAYKTHSIILYHLPSLMVMFLSSSFLKRTVWTPEIAFTTVDLPWATWPIVPDKKNDKFKIMLCRWKREHLQNVLCIPACQITLLILWKSFKVSPWWQCLLSIWSEWTWWTMPERGGEREQEGGEGGGEREQEGGEGGERERERAYLWCLTLHAFLLFLFFVFFFLEKTGFKTEVGCFTSRS